MSIDHGWAIEKCGLGGEMPMWIGGALGPADEGGTLGATNPTTGEEIARFPNARASDVGRAVASARTAFDAGPWWNEWGTNKRARCLKKLAGLVKEHEKVLARTETMDVGMPYGMSLRFSATALRKNLEYFAGLGDALHGETIPQASPTHLDYTRREPLGVVAAIIPWNTPLLAIGSKIGPALVAGNTVILKPSEKASLSALKVAELAAEAGFPDGVLQVVTGDGETGSLLVGHAGVDKVSFTGGGRTASAIQQATSEHLTPLTFELGGKSPNVIFADADLDKVSMQSAMGVFGLSGQACAAGSRVLVERSIHDQVVADLTRVAGSLGLGDPLQPYTMLGPLNSEAHADHVRSMIAEAQEDGATLHHATPVPEECGPAFVGPHIFTNVTPDMRLWKNEVFGPVAAVTAFDTEEEALSLANDTEFGLAAGIWTQNLGRAHRMAHRIRAGVIWVNCYGTLPNNVPFGGFKKSGAGREGGVHALAEFTQVKNVLIDVG
jgi:acyl-CoA reductase-like NAD-dependent aldehyde dehydrogenase